MTTTADRGDGGGRVVRVGTRGSALARAQATLAAAALAAQGIAAELVIIQTEGDRRAPDTAWGEGAFVTAIEQALRDGRVDVAVHSAKDVPVRIDPALAIGAYLPRAVPADALVLATGSPWRGLDDLPAGARIGTDSPRRTGFLLARRPDLRVHPLHGNVDTRLRRLDAGETDALVLAVAGLSRLGLGDRVGEVLDPEVVPPAPGQGAVALQCRADDAATLAALAAIDDEPTHAAVDAERRLLAIAGGGCRAPIGAHGTVRDGVLRLVAGYARPDGTAAAIEVREGPIADGASMAAELVAALDARVPGLRRAPGARPRVLVTRAAVDAPPLVAALEEAGVEAVVVPAIETAPAPDAARLDDALATLPDGAWVVVTSANGADAAVAAAGRAGIDPARRRWAAVGEGTGARLRAGGVEPAWLPARANGRAIAEGLPADAGEVVLLARGNLASTDLPEGLRARGIDVREVVAYEVREAPAASRDALRTALAGGPVDAVVTLSGSAVRGLLALAEGIGPDALATVSSIPVVCIGPETEAVARDRGLEILGVAGMQRADALAALVAGLVLPPGAGAPARPTPEVAP